MPFNSKLLTVQVCNEVYSGVGVLYILILSVYEMDTPVRMLAPGRSGCAVLLFSIDSKKEFYSQLIYR